MKEKDARPRRICCTLFLQVVQVVSFSHKKGHSIDTMTWIANTSSKQYILNSDILPNGTVYWTVVATNGIRSSSGEGTSKFYYRLCSDSSPTVVVLLTYP